MKRKFTLLIAALALLTMIVQPGRAWGQTKGEITWTASAQGYTNQQEITSVTFDSSVSGSFNKGTNSNPPKYYTTGTAIRCYGGNYFTISSSNTLTAITISFGNGDGSNAITTDVGTYSNGSWTGSANSVTFTIGGSSGNRRIAGFNITYSSGGTPTHTLTFGADPAAGGTVTVGSSTSGSIDLAEAATVSVSATANTGYEFDGWTVSGTDSSVEDEDEASTTFTMGTADATLTANFTQVNTYTVTYKANGPEAVDVVDIYNSGATVTVRAANTFSYAGHAFTEWNTNADGTGTEYQPGATIENISDNIDLYAQWEESSEATATLNIQSYATANNWSNSVQYLTATVDQVTFTAAGGGNTGKYYTNGQDWRFYQNENATLTISVPNGYHLVSITPTFSTSNSGVLLNGSTSVTSNSTVSASGTSVTFSVGNSGTATNGQVKFTNIIVNYEYEGGTTTPSYTITDNNELAYNATSGSFDFTVNNPVDGGVTTVSEDVEWISNATISENSVTFNTTANTGAQRAGIITLTYTYNTTETVTKEVTITQAAAPVVYSTIPALFAAATSTETNVLVTFNNWVVSGVSTNGKSIFVTDNNGNGFVIYYTSDMSNTFAAGNVLSGTAVSCTLKLYNGFAELLNVDANDLTITTGGTVTVANVTMADLTGVNTGALVHYENLTCSVDNNKYYLSDGTTTIQVYNAIFAFEALEADNTYNITGVYQQFNSTKEVLPRSADDIVEVTIPVLTTENVDIACDATEGVITYTVTNPASDGNLTAEITAGNEGNWLTLGTIGANVPFTCTANMGAERTATVTLTYTYNTTETVTATAVVTQVAYVAPTASIVVTPTEVNATAAETEGTIIVTYENITTVVAEVYFCDAQGAATTYEWVDAEIDDDDNVYYTIDANTGEARTAYLKVHAFDDDANDVYSDLVTINQAAYVVDYATLPFTYDGNGLGTLPNGLTQEGLTDKYNNSPKMKFDGTGDWLLLHINERPGTLTFDIKGNSFSGGTFTIQTSVDGVTYTDLQAYTELGDTQSVEFGNLAEDVRYIKWIYTNKSSGNVGLGNIALAQYVEPQPSITINPGPYNLNSEGGDAVLPVTYTNMPTDPQADVIFYESDGETPLTENPTWITATINNDGNVDGHIDANTGDARSAYFKVKGKDADGNDVYSGLVTVNQAAYTLSIVFETTSLDIEAGGEQNRIISFEYEGLGENPTFTVRTYDAIGETQTTYDWLTTSITDVHKVSITVAANTGDARSAYFKVYGENGTVNTESNLVTINQAAAGQTVQYTLITSVDDLTPGYHYLIASEASEGDLNIMDVQNSNNRGVKAATVDEYNTITFTPNAAYYDFVISGDTNNGWTIYDESTTKTGYLYAASSTKNYLRTQSSNDANGIWSITINNEGVATIVAQGSNTRNTMQYNSSNSLFACYGSASESDVYLYKKVGDTNPVYYSPTIVEVENPNADAESIVILNNEIFTYTGTLKCSSPDHLVIHDGGQLIHGDDVPATLLKDYEAAPWPSSKSVNGWYTIASPVANGDLSAVVSNVTNYDFFAYDEAAYTWRNQKVPANNINAFEQGIGYLYATAAAKQGSFAGTMKATNATIEKDLSYACTVESLKGFNLMGNPFTRNLTSADVELGGVELTNYYVVEGGSELEARNIADNPIKPGQGFMVQASAENQKLVFNPSSKGRSANKGNISIAVGNESFNDMAYINIANGNTLRKMTLNADSPKVYVMNNNLDYAAARVEGLSGSMPVCFQTKNIGTYTITIQANELDVEYLHLIDNVLHEDIDMLLEPSYSFIASGHDYAARFTLVFKANANIDEIEVNDNFAYQNGSDIIVNGNGELQVFDVTGRMVMNTKINGIQTVNVPATGMYIFRMVGESVQTQKIVVR